MVDLTKKQDARVIGRGNRRGGPRQWGCSPRVVAAWEGPSCGVGEARQKSSGGGTPRHTRNMRCAHDAATDILTGPYTEQEFWEDLQRVTDGQTDEDLARL